MSFSKITSYSLYIIAGISVIVMLFFYAAPKTLDYDALEAKVDSLTTTTAILPVAPVTDTTKTDSGTVAQAPAMQQSAPAPAEEVNLREELSGWEYLVWSRTDIALIWGYILLVIALLAAVILPLIGVVTNTKALVRLGGVLAAAAVIILISYLLSSDTPIEIIGYEKFDNRDPVTLKWIDTGLFTTYALFGFTLIAILYSAVSKIFK